MNNTQAFPEIYTETVGERGDYRQEVKSEGGMTLRDYFAAKAMHALLASEFRKDGSATMFNVARDAYRMADEMTKAREA